MSEIELRVYANLKKYIPDLDLKDGKKVSINNGITIQELLNQFGIPERETKILIVNGIHADLDQKLKDGDRVAIFPPVAGGSCFI
ncbi:MAG: hypothetical protein A2W05_04145 [Candidatus Schekmanbacteria bacterium RBG_16_38_10]|uniref:Molybdopterin synthase sulfur carrier subunit n=1 Tax=Candidatus Schekmanbacteria bacterium RBG_16_38_10 TaxID=1817879 RepID=A0A1F7RNT3_9BACT|nr:MAG: hypothetical protein A2W05_04145 [Candidatus Schekmanbacteria bacterium RBG_16_38_10]